jgi:RNA polymerase sigma factor (sigma-70 family)
MQRENDVQLAEFAQQAKLGDRDCLDRLSRLIEPRLRAYIYRATLDSETTCDLLQEVLLQVITSISTLENAANFRPWAFRIASNKIRDFYRARKRKTAAQFSTLEDSLLESVLQDENSDSEQSMVRKELAQRIVESMGRLKHRYRSIVALRCFEDMSYSDIAQAVGCTEMDARVSFFRAKRQMKKQLSRVGFSGGSLALAIGLFGAVTGPGEASAATIAVSGSVLKTTGISAAGGISKLLTPKVAACVLGGALAAAACWLIWGGETLTRDQVRSVHYYVHSTRTDPCAPSSRSVNPDTPNQQPTSGLISHGVFEMWQKFPQGPDGPIIRAEQRWTSDQKEKLCHWLQDGNAYYYYHSGEKTLYILNGTQLGGLLFPTDPPEYAEFIFETLGRSAGIEYIRDEESGLIMKKIDRQMPEFKTFKFKYEYNKCDDDVFVYSWPGDVKVVDMRDDMHKRGWTYFSVDGELGGNEIHGFGRIPFVYAQIGEHAPWLIVHIGDEAVLTDSAQGAYFVDDSSAVRACYPAGSFFKGFPRPWYGFRTLDSVRRDAAEQRIPFKSEATEEKATVTISKTAGYTNAELVYEIDMEKDLIEKITISCSGSPRAAGGELRFSYPESIGETLEDMPERAPMTREVAASNERGMLWLIDLAEGTLLN